MLPTKDNNDAKQAWREKVALITTMVACSVFFVGVLGFKLLSKEDTLYTLNIMMRVMVIFVATLMVIRLTASMIYECPRNRTYTELDVESPVMVMAPQQTSSSFEWNDTVTTTTTSDDLSNVPAVDAAEDNAFFPSPYSLSLYTGPKTDYDGSTYPDAYTGKKWRILCLMTDERYMMTKNGKLFSSGNHPVESLLPILHLTAAGFEVDIYTLSGNLAKMEMWAMPSQDEAVQSIYQEFLPKLKNPHKLSNANLGPDSPYIAVLFPGGHGAMNSIPFSTEVKGLLQWAMAKDKHIISLCHGPACFLAAAVGEKDKDNYLFKGYEMCVFPDSIDEGANVDIGYIPGRLEWLLGASLQKLGVKIINNGLTGQTHKDRKVITGDGPTASNQLGKVSAAALLTEVHSIESTSQNA